MRIIKSYEDNKVMWMNENVEIEFLHRVDRECDENYLSDWLNALQLWEMELLWMIYTKYMQW